MLKKLPCHIEAVSCVNLHMSALKGDYTVRVETLYVLWSKNKVNNMVFQCTVNVETNRQNYIWTRVKDPEMTCS